jgi:hypothetical protein
MTTLPLHHEERLCTVEPAEGVQDSARRRKIVAVCTCGRTREYSAAEVEGHGFVCSGLVISKYRADVAKTITSNPRSQ